jgi:16S rRNA G1207 methylase RsmC
MRCAARGVGPFPDVSTMVNDQITLTLDPPDRARVCQALRSERLVVWSRDGLPPRDRLLLEALPPRPGQALTVLDTRGVAALALRALAPEQLQVPRHMALDARDAARARRVAAAHPRRVPVDCAADLPMQAEDPEAGFDLVVLSAPSEWPLAVELIEQAHDALRVGGRLLVGAERGSQEVRARVKKIFGTADVQVATRKPVPACVIAARRQRAAPRWRDRTRPVARALRGQQLEVFARPGVQDGRALAPGVTALSEVMEVPLGGAVCELDCGNGALGIVCGRLGAARVTLADTSVRAAALARAGAEHAGLVDVRALAVPHYDAARLEGRPFDVVVAALSSRTELARAGDIVRAAHDALREGGRLQITGRRPDELEELVRAHLGDVERTELDGHTVISARRLAQHDA